MVAHNVAPDVQFNDDALVPFLKQHTLSKTPSERAQVVDDWTRMIIATQQGCSSALMHVPYAMKTHPSNSIAKSLRYEADGCIVVEVHFNMFLGVDREEVQALKVEMRRNKEDMEKQITELREEAEHSRHEMRHTMTAMQKIIEARDVKDELAKKKKAITMKNLRKSQKIPTESAPSNEDTAVENQETDTAATTTVATGFSCTVDACKGKSFESKKQLLNHKRKHNDAEHPCPNTCCTETLKQRNHVKRHLRTCKFAVK
jgi:hypothetical protein